LPAQFTYPPEKRGAMEARLTVEASQPSQHVPGIGEVTLTLEIQGPESLEVEEPHLGDPTATWKEERPPARRSVEKGWATWSQVLHLKQVKPGVATPPDVSVRFRAGPDADWEEARWVDIFKYLREPAPPEPPEPQRSWLRRWGPILLTAAVTLVLAVWLFRRRQTRPASPLPPEQWALRELDRIQEKLMPPSGDAEAFHTQLSQVIRRYLAERFVPHALQQTTVEFLDAVRQVPQLTEMQQGLLRELFERCDLAKFARASTPPEECRRTAEMARDLIGQTIAPPRPARRS
jgi:hypothetical protein